MAEIKQFKILVFYFNIYCIYFKNLIYSCDVILNINLKRTAFTWNKKNVKI